MRKTIYKLCRAGLVWLVPAALISCQHKELCYDHSHVVEVKVNFDWSECPDAAPRTMVLQLFTPDGSHCNRYEFGSPKGGVIRVQAGSYRMLFHNGDMENVVERGTCYDDYEVTTAARALLAPIGRGGEQAPPRPGDAQEQPVRHAPDPVWCGQYGPVDWSAVPEGEELSVTLVPGRATAVYTVDFLHIENLGSTSNIGAAITGLAGSYRPCHGKMGEEAVTIPLDLTRVDDRTLSARFATFGHCPVGTEKHTLSIYTAEKWFSHFDVTDQVHGAADPDNVHVVIDGLRLPDSAGGMDTSVSDWDDSVIETDINMN